MTTTPIRVLLVDDHAMIRSGIKAYLMGRSDVLCVGEAGDGQEALDLLPALQPDVVLLDVQMPRMGGIEAAALIRRNHPGIRIIMLTSFQDQQVAMTALQMGASGYLLKDVAEDDLIATIRLAHAGHVLLPPGAASQLDTSEVQPQTQPGPAYTLSYRERQVLSLVVSGLSNKEIARRLSLSLSTVKFHVSNIIAKLGASSRVEAATIALQSGLVDEV